MRYKLRDLITIKHGFAFSGEHIKTEDNGVVLVTPGNFRIGGGFKEDKCKFFDGDYSDEYVLHSGDLLVTMTDLSKAIDTLGYSAIVPQTKRVYLHNQRIGLVRITSDILDKGYLYWFMRTPQYQKTIAATSSGSTVHHTSPDRIRDVEIDLPDIEKQKRVAGFLSTIDAKIELNNWINENLFEQMTSYYKHLFSQIPLTATVGGLSGCIFSGGTPSTGNDAYWNGPYFWLSSGETSNRFIVSTQKTITDEGVNNSSTRKANQYDIVIASAGQGHTRGQTSMLLTDTYVNQSIIVVHATPDLIPFLFWNIANRYEELRIISNSNSIRGSLTTKMISSLEIPGAGGSQILKFSRLAWPVIHMIEKNLNESHRLTILRDSLLPKLMSGELDVSEIDL